VLIKTGADVLVSVRNAVAGADLGQLRKTVEQEFLSLNEQEESVRTVLAKLEADLMRRMATFHNG
jgi:F-type H+-transporting ATPase subunit epsilon